MTTTAKGHHPYDDHPLQAAAQTSRTDRNTSLDALHALEAALSEPAPSRHSQWIDTVRGALEQLQQALDAQAASDREATSLLSEVASDQPRLIPRIDRLRRQHKSLRESVQATLDELSAQADQDHLDTADVRDRVADLARRLRHHRAQEADLIYEAVNLNLGVSE
jgi:hypothetical protein